MSSIDQLRKNFDFSPSTEQFNQIRPSRPFRRNQSQPFDNITSQINNNPITSPMNNNPVTSPINHMDIKVIAQLISKIKVLIRKIISLQNMIYMDISNPTKKEKKIWLF